MELQEIREQARSAYDDGRYSDCIRWSLSATFHTIGLSWPYFLLGECYGELGREGLSKAFYSLYLGRAREGSKTWVKRAKSRLSS